MLRQTPVRIVLFLAAASALPAQSSRASILGQVSDASRAGIPNATVSVVRPETNARIETLTDANGFYSVAFLPAGQYVVTATAKGFRAVRHEGVTLETDVTLDLPITLDLGDVQDKVTVASEPEQIETTTASRTQRLNPEKLKELPLMGRQAYSLVSLTPGVVFTQEQFGTTGFAGLRGWDANGRFIINGGREGTNQFLLQGAPVSLTGRWQFSPSVDAIQEFKVMTNTYDAQFGRTGGGTVVTSLKSGTNRWRGTVWHYAHNSVLDANTTQNNRVGAPKGQHNTHQFGGNTGGPLRRDKDFIFVSFEGFREIVPFPVVSDTVPLDLRTGQNFNRYNIRVYDPLSARPCVDGIDATRCASSFIRRRFPGDRIPASRISPIGRRILDLYPRPNSPGLTSNFLASGNRNRYNYNQPIAKWDHVAGERNRFNVVAALERGSDLSSTNGFPPPAEVGNRSALRLSQHYIAEWVHVRSPNTVFDVRLSFGRFTEFFPDASTSSDLTAFDLGISRMPTPPTITTAAPPRVNIDLFSSIIGNTYSWSTQNQWSLQPSVIQTRGRHVLQYGVEVVHAALGSAGPGRANGEFSFTRAWSQQYVNRPDGTSRSQGVRDGSGVADLLLGVPSSGFIDYNQSFYRSWPYVAIYFNDNWKVAPRWTLNLGLRYDVQVPLRERYNRVNAGWDFTSKNPLSDRVLARWREIKQQYDAANPGLPYPDPPAVLYGGRLFASESNPRPHATDWSNLQPRLGLAWRLAPKTVLRAGIGVFHRTAGQLSQTAGFNQRTNYISTIDGLIPSAGLNGPYSLENPFPQGLLEPTGASLGLLTNVGNAATFDGRQRLIPRTFQYSFGFQHEFRWGLMFEATYAGSQTVKDFMPVQLNAVGMADFERGGRQPLYLNRRLPSPFYGVLPESSDLGSSVLVSAYNLLRPYPLFGGITQTTNPWARYRYDSLQFMAQRRFKELDEAGLFTFLFSYTFSKSFEQARRLNDWNLAERPVKQLTAFDKPHTLALSGLWELPVGWGRRYFNNVPRVAGAFINGWSVDWILSYNTGYPVARPDANFTCGSYLTPGGPTPQQWFNNDPACWELRGQYSLRTGPERFGEIRNPSAPQLHLSVEKMFWLNERFSLQLRGESFNVTNTPIYPGPFTNFRDPRFGQLPFQQNNFPRFVQIAARLSF